MSLSRSKVGGRTSPLGQFGSMDLILLLASLALSGFGIFAVYVAGADDAEAYALNQTLGFFVGLAAAVPLALFDYRQLRGYLPLIYGLGIVLLLAVTVTGISAKGAQRWIDIGPVQVQPSEFAKLIVVVVLAGYFSENRLGEHVTFLKALGILSVPALLVFAQPDLGTALVFGAAFFTMAYIAGAKLIQLAGLVAGAVAAAVLAVKLQILEAYQVARLTAFVSCYDEFSELCYQVASSKMAIGSGGITGKGLDAQTLANLGYLPAEHTDFIFSNFAERVGFMGSILLIVLFFFLVWRILHVATISRDRFGVLIAVGVATVFLFHVFVNVGMT